MKNLLLICFATLFSTTVFGQIVKLNPATVTAADSVEIIFDATQGTKGLVGASTVYIHTGVILSSPTGTDWQNVVGNYGKDDGIGKMTKVPNEADKWRIKIAPSILAYYKLPAGTTVFRLSMVFRNADGSKEGKGTPGTFTGGAATSNGDIYLDLDVRNFVQFKAPLIETNFLTLGSELKITSEASAVADSMVIQVNNGSGYSRVAFGAKVNTLSYDLKASKTEQLLVKTIAYFGGNAVEQIKTIKIVVRGTTLTAPLPVGVRKGINYLADKSKAVLVLEAPKKEFAYVIGDFTNWEINDAYLMNKTPDGEFYWLTINNLIPKKEYVFQYWVNGTIKIGDPYADKVADPFNDKFIPASIYPNLPDYTKTENEIASVLQTDQTPYSWAASETTWQRPDKNNLIIYELLVRDFIGSHSYKDLTDTLSYLKKLGVNTIELMPIMEFEGNESWGYNPSYFMAPDKYYGTKNDLKKFIETAHKQGFAVVLDMVLNHAFGQNPMVKLYFQDGKPTVESPWFNIDATHPFNVGYDFNHESKYTQAFVDSVNTYWLKEYHFDGYRFDLSKGFTQRNNANNVDAWGRRDESRIAILKRMAAKIKSVDKNAYIILEHFAEASEENELKTDGMMVWGNNTHDYGDLLTGKTSATINSAAQQNRVSYMESHDEERLMVKALGSSARSTAYAVNNELTALNRIKLLAAFFYPLPGPKMMWQFQELGYDKSIDFNGRVGNKPLVWGSNSLNLYGNAERQKLYKTHAAIINLVRQNPTTFGENNVTTNFNGIIKSIKADGVDLDVAIIGNFDLTTATGTINFTHTGTWHNFFGQDSITVSNTAVSVELAPGEFRLYTDKKTTKAAPDLLTTFQPIVVTDPVNFNASTEVKLTFRAKLANKLATAGLVGTNEVYMIAGVVATSGSDTTLTKRITEISTKTKLTKVAGKDDEWQIKINPRTFFGVAESESIFRIGMYFQNADGSRIGKAYDGGNIYLNLQSDGKLVSVSPAEFQPETTITITFDASVADPNGTAGLVGSDKVYMHAGIITDGPSETAWKYVKGNYGKDDGIGLMTKVTGSNSKYQITITPKNYFADVPSNATWNRIGMVFRNADGSREGKAAGNKDIFVNFTQKIVDPQTPLATEEYVVETTVVYPNPSVNQLKIVSDKLLETAMLFTLSGSKIGNFELQPAGLNTYTVDVDDVKSGNYLVVLKHKKGVITKRILITK